MIDRLAVLRGAANPRPFTALRCRRAAAPLAVRLFLLFGVAVIGLTLLAAAAAGKAGESEAEPAPETMAILAHAACYNAVRDAYWQAVTVCLALSDPADRGQCGAAARTVRQFEMARCQEKFGDVATPAP